MRRWLIVPSVLAVLLVVVSVAAAAGRPVVEHFRGQGIDHEFSAELTQACGFPITVRFKAHETHLFYPDGSTTEIIHYTATYLTARGPQLIEDDDYRVHGNASQTIFTFTGIPFRIEDPSGRVLIKDRGFARFDFTNGFDEVLHGPHPSLVDGFDLCAAMEH